MFELWHRNYLEQVRPEVSIPSALSSAVTLLTGQKESSIGPSSADPDDG